MTPRVLLGKNASSRLPLLPVLVFALGLFPSLAGAQTRDWAVVDSSGPDQVGCTYCEQSYFNFVPPSVRSSHAVAADAAGNSWIVGGSSNGTNYDVVTVKYDANGAQQWSVTYDGGGDDSAGAVAVDAAGNVYVAGTTNRMTWEFDLQPHAMLLKYSPNGSLLWERVYRSGVSSQGMALAVDASGQSYLAVQNYSGDDYIWAELLKTSSTGAGAGSDSAYFGFEYEEQGPTAVALDAGGNAYMAGWVYKPSAPDQTDYFVLKFGGWAQRHDSGQMDVAYDLTVDGSGRVFVTGNRGTAAFGPTGTPLWSAPFTGTPQAVVAADGGVWVAGTSAQDFRTARYDAATGAQSWSVLSGGAGDQKAYVLRKVGGTVYVAGSSFNGTNRDALTVGLDAATGAEVWRDLFDNGGNESVYAMAATGAAFWVAGTAGTDSLTIRYELPPPAGPVLTGLTLTPNAFPGGCKTSTGRVTLSAPAPAGGLVVSLTNTNPVAVVPASVTVPAGQIRAAFTITAPAVTTAHTGTVTAAYGGQSYSAALKVRPVGVLSLVLSPNPVTGPGRVEGSVMLECAAPAGGVTVQLSSSDRTVAWPSVASIVIPAGSATGRFTVSTADVAAPQAATIKAVAAGVSKTVRLEVR